MTITLRELGPADGPAIARLCAEAPDTGRVSFSPVYKGDAYETLRTLKPGMVGVVAEAAEHDGLVGMGLLEFGRCLVAGRPQPYALLSSLMVHPNFRRRGIASRLARWRVDRAEERLGEDGIILANVQRGNTASRRTAERWTTQVLPPFSAIPFRFRRRPPRPPAGIEVRPVERADLGSFADHLDHFYGEHVLHRPETPDDLGGWLEATRGAVASATDGSVTAEVATAAGAAAEVAEAAGATGGHARTGIASPSIRSPPNRHLLVATDRSGALLAGLSVDEVHHLMTLRVAKLPFVMRAADRALSLLPADGEMRIIRVGRFWFAPGRQDAARYLFETVRHRWRGTATAIVAVVDERSPIAPAYGIRPWSPRGRASTFVRSARVLAEGEAIRPIV